ncbi:MAG: WD40 repeat domain-containing protein [Gemmataceae bacterium]
MRFFLLLLVWIILSQVQPTLAQTLKGHTKGVTALAFSPNGKRLLSVGEDGRVLVWEVETQKLAHQYPPIGKKLYAAAWHPDGSQFAIAGEHGLVQLWKIEGKKPTAEYEGHIGPVVALAFRPDGKVLASGGYLRTIRFWTVGNEWFNTIQDLDGRVTSLGFTDDGQSLVVGTAELTEQRINGQTSNRYGESGFVRVYNAKPGFDSGKLLRKLDVRGSQVAVAGTRVLAAGLVAFEKTTQNGGKRELHTGGMSVVSIADLKTGKAVATASLAGLSAAWSKDGSVVACGGLCYRHYPGNLMFGNREGRPDYVAFAAPLNKNEKITTIAIDPRERRSNNIVGGDENPPVMLRDPETLQKGVVIDHKKGEIVAVSHDGRFFAVGGKDGVVQLQRTPRRSN